MEITHEEVVKLKPGRYMMIDGRPCEIKNMETSKPGKHGHAKCRITGIDVLTGSKKQAIYTTHDKVEVPIIEKKTAQVLSVADHKAQVMDMQTYETFEAEIPEEFRGKVEPNKEIIYWELMGVRVIKQVKSGE